jgi:predicted ATP-grasp superfamily ATP-dependent carboligase
VVVGLDCITGLQTARILAARGVPVIGIATDARHYCARTSVCEQILQTNTAGAELIGTLAALGPELRRKAVLFPCTDDSVVVIAAGREALQPWFHIALPPSDILATLYDKDRFHSYAQRLGLPVPQTFALNCRGDVESAAAVLTYPCILKPTVKTAHWQQNTNAKVFQAENAEALLDLYDRCAEWTDTLIAQQWIPGCDTELYSCNCYFDERSEPLVTFVARKIRQWPPHTGISCLGEECRNDVVLALALRLFQSAGLRGLGYLEVKRDPRTGAHYLIEANIGRPTGRSAIAEAGGVELLYTMYCDLTGRPLPEARTQTYRGAKWIHWRQDVRSAWYYWRCGELTLHEWMRSWRGRKAEAVFSWSDPGPFLADAISLSRGLLARAKRNPAGHAPTAELVERSPLNSTTVR